MTPTLRPMLCSEGSTKLLESGSYLFEPKLDGIRALIEKSGTSINIINRRGKIVTYKYPEIVRNINLHAETVVLDGEIVILDGGRPNFYRIEERELISDPLRIEILSELHPATYYVFDILYVDGEPLLSKPLEERKKLLNTIVQPHPRIDLCLYTEDGKTLFNSIKSFNLEGVIAKLKGSPYEPGKRSRYWLKIKNYKTIDTIICGYTYGKGVRSQYFGALVLGLYKGNKLMYIGKVGTGWTELQLKHLVELLKPLQINTPHFDIPYEVIWVRPCLVAVIQYIEWTEDLRLRNPSFKRLRFDKSPEDCRFNGTAITVKR